MAFLKTEGLKLKAEGKNRGGEKFDAEAQRSQRNGDSY
jgi:hypothetical protein